MAEFKISRFRYTWKGTWTTGTVYIRDDVVRYGGSSYVCLRGHTAAANFYTDVDYIVPNSIPAINEPAWVLMTKGAAWRDAWTASTLYNLGDIVQTGGVTYICTVPHTSSNTFLASSTNWNTYVLGSNWAGEWAGNTRYAVGDTVKFHGIVYRCITEHTSNPGDKLENQNLTWEVVFTGSEYVTSWTASTNYYYNDLVKYGGSIWRANQTHIAGATFNTTYWNIDLYGYQFGNEWTNGTLYQMGDIVRYGGWLYYSEVDNNDQNPLLSADQSSIIWTKLAEGYNVRGEWNATSSYKPGDLVRRGGEVYVAISTSDTDGSSLDYMDTSNWKPINTGSRWKGQWASTTTEGTRQDLIIHNTVVNVDVDYVTFTVGSSPIAALYVTKYQATGEDSRAWFAIQEGPSWTASQVAITDAMLAYGHFGRAGQYVIGDNVLGGYVLAPNTQYTMWIQQTGNQLTEYIFSTDPNYVDSGIPADYSSNPGSPTPLRIETSSITTGNPYSVGDLVTHAGGTYRCTYPHISSEETFPGDNGSYFGYWETYVAPGDYTTMSYLGDMPTYGLSRLEAGDGSTFGPKRLAIGNEDELLMVDQTGGAYYKKYGTAVQYRYVAPNGTDREDFGQNQYTPYKTIRYACEQVENVGGKVLIKVAPGTYTEILPIVLHAGVTVQGDETRVVTVQPNTPIANLSLDSTYTIAVLTRLKLLIADILLAVRVEASISNTETQSTTVAASSLAVQAVSAMIDDIISYIRFYVNSTGTDPIVTGSNSATVSVGRLLAIQSLIDNTAFLQAEAVAFMQDTYGAYVFDSDKCARDVLAYINAWKYDLLYPGNYKSLLAARYYKNAVLGSVGEDMFYLRDATGVRNMTLKGLTGSLNPQGVYEFYQRPTGGAYCAFDPGWGPADESTWIMSRSPYIQNCATFGYAVTGQRMDGDLHNGGNKSFVSNDFTQLISDGIGAHVLNGARAELVSVFTYYAQVGYLAENGAIIRATNGNCSYGKYGAMSIGVDSTEVPVYGSVNNRNNPAEVAAAFAGEVGITDQILALEFANAGQNYRSATYSIVGAGINANAIADDFRDGAVFESLILDPSDSTNGGGGSYSQVIANAQSGSPTTLKLSIFDDYTEAQYLGLRVVIVSGAGVGQYGYIGAYNVVSKVADIYKESSDQPGWDHIIPGYAIEDTLLPNTRYSIEPRPVFSSPTFSAGTINFPSSLSFANIVYGETRGTYTGLNAGAPTGTVNGQDGLTLTSAVWSVSRVGRDYTVSLTSAGAGYAEGQVLTILGTSLGGITPDNDITIRVTSISNDSTNSITGYANTGLACSGVFVATTNNSDSVIYSKNGINWLTTTMPSSAVTWNVLASGNNMFVAAAKGTTKAAYSYDGITWTEATLTSSDWESATYGNGRWVIVSSTGNDVAYSTNGTSWTLAAMAAGDSTFNEWRSVAWGINKYVAIASSGNFAATSSDGATWAIQNLDAQADSTQVDWKSLAYGNGRWVAISTQGVVGYSLDGADWKGSTLPSPDGSTIMNWKKVAYGQGVFFAICDTDGIPLIGEDPVTGTTTYAATSYDGITWTPVTLAGDLAWEEIAFGNPKVSTGNTDGLLHNTGMWILLPTSGSAGNRVLTGATAKGRISVSSGRVSQVKLWDPGSGYTSSPTLTIIDPNNTSEVLVNNRIGDGVLAQPSWANRGAGYKTSSTVTTVVGTGFADVIPDYRYVTISGLAEYPKVGAQLIFTGNETIFTSVIITRLGDLGDGTLSVSVQVAPDVSLTDNFVHGTQVMIRQKYSQCRITGHDWLDIGTGNFVDSNYPELYSGLYYASPENEVVEVTGGRVFYTSTDQNGNFRTGELFAVEQATGIVTISADFFDFAGLTELRLGGVRLGGSGVVVQEFSTDALFTADSNNIIPTQRAIKTYLANKLAVSGSDLVTNGFKAGEISVGGQYDEFDNVLDRQIIFNRRADFSGAKANISGQMLAQTMFIASFKQDGQE